MNAGFNLFSILFDSIVYVFSFVLPLALFAGFFYILSLLVKALRKYIGEDKKNQDNDSHSSLDGK